MRAISYRFDPGFRHHIAGWSSLVARRAHNPEVVRFKSHPRNQITKGHRFGVLLLFRLQGKIRAYVLRVMPTSVARWVSEAKTPRGGVFGEAKSSTQGAEGEGCAPTRGNYAAGRARSDNPEVCRPYSREGQEIPPFSEPTCIISRQAHATVPNC